MKHFVLLTSTFVLALLSSCSVNQDRSMAEMIDQKRSAARFSSVELAGPIDIDYHQSDKHSIVVTAPKELLDRITTTISDGCLYISVKEDNKLFTNYDYDDVVITVSSPDLVGVRVTGSGSFDAKGIVDTDNMTATLIGSGDIEFEQLLCDQLSASVTGSGDIEFDQVRCLASQLNIIGSGDIEANFYKSGALECRVTGSGDIKLKGEVATTNLTALGSGDIDASQLRILSASKPTHK